MEVTYRMQEGFRLPNLLMPQEPETPAAFSARCKLQARRAVRAPAIYALLLEQPDALTAEEQAAFYLDDHRLWQLSASASAPDSALESSLQRTIHSSLVPLNSARTVVVPLPTAVMVPLEVTVATEAFSLVNVTCAPSGMLLTIRGACSPG